MLNQRMNFNPAPIPLSTIVSQIRNVNRGGLDLQPDYQRDFVWNQDFKEKLIYSLIKRYPIGSISIRNLEDINVKSARSEVVDGQQRLTTIYNFLTGTSENNYNDFKIGNEYARKIIDEIIDFMGDVPNNREIQKLKIRISKKGNIFLRYSDLPQDIKDDMNTYPLSISYISNATTQQISEYFRFLQNQETLRAGEIMRSFPHTFLERYLDKLEDKAHLLKVLNYSDKRLEFDKLFYSVVGLFDRQISFGSQDKIIKSYVFNKQSELEGSAMVATKNLVRNLNKIAKAEDYVNPFKPTKRYLKLLLLLSAFNSLDFDVPQQHLINLHAIDEKLAKFSSVAENALLEAFDNNINLIEPYRKFAEMCVRTHNFDVVSERMSDLPQLVVTCPF